MKIGIEQRVTMRNWYFVSDDEDKGKSNNIGRWSRSAHSLQHPSVLLWTLDVGNNGGLSHSGSLGSTLGSGMPVAWDASWLLLLSKTTHIAIRPMMGVFVCPIAPATICRWYKVRALLLNNHTLESKDVWIETRLDWNVDDGVDTR